ncbi:hypothetical protein C0J52_16916 [Blattella germanica]|nr:hypothetical protein C0J52_16916 [Blattella germanica]
MFTCVNCGNQVQELFKKYSPTVLKLMHCEKCNQVADKYIEYDPVIVMIDLVLLNERAYRHILYNSPFQSHWRLAIVLVLFEAYSSWATKKNEEALNSINMYHYDLFEGEGSFYFMCIQAILGSAILFLFTYFLTWLRWKIHPLDKPKNYNNIILWKALVLSNCGKFLIIPSLIWGEIGTQIHSFFILGYIFISQLKTYAEKQKEVVDQSKNKGKRKRLNIVAGKNISAEEIQQMSSLSTSEDKNVPSISKGRKNNPRKKKLESESESESEISYASESSLNLSEELMEDSPIEHTPTQAYVPKPVVCNTRKAGAGVIIFFGLILKLYILFSKFTLDLQTFLKLSIFKITKILEQVLKA